MRFTVFWAAALAAGCVKYAPVELQTPIRYAPEPGLPAICLSLAPDAGRLPGKEAEAWASVRAAVEGGDLESAFTQVQGLGAHPARESVELAHRLVTDGSAETAAAIEAFASARPEDACALQLAATAQVAHDQEKAKHFLERAYAIEPENADIALLYTLFSEHADAREKAGALLKVAESHAEHLPSQVLAGRAAVAVGDLDGAVAAFERAYSGGAEDVAEALFHLRRMTGHLGPYLSQAEAEGEPVTPLAFGGDPPAELDAWLGFSGDDDRLQATFATSQGDVHCMLYHQEAPVTVINFVALARGQKSWTDPSNGDTVERPLYDDTVFHRVIPEFMIQGGDPLGTGEGFPGYRFRDELHPMLRFDRPGRLAMANSGPDTNGSQFFITEVPTPHLDGLHTIFGQCDNLDVVEAIARVPTDGKDKPETAVVLQGVSFQVLHPIQEQ